MESILNGILAAADLLIPVLYTLLIAAALDTVTGVWAAYQSGAFNSEFLPTFIKSHLLTKITPIFLLLLAGVSVGGTDSAAGIALVTSGGASAAAYLASVVGSIRDNVSEGNARVKSVPTSVAIDSAVTPANEDIV